MMLKANLTQKEKETLYNLVRYPTFNDRELSEKTGLKLSTITAIRRRLRKDNFFCTKKIPLLQNMGCELLMVGYGTFSVPLHDEPAFNLGSPNIKLSKDEFLAFQSSNQGVFISIMKNYTEAKRDIDDFQHFFNHHGMMDELGWVYTIFPFEVSKILSFFDFSGLLANLFKIERPQLEAVPDLGFSTTKEVNLTTKEKKVLLGLVKYPELPDNVISKKVGVSRQAVSSMKKRFEEEHILKTVRIPNLETLGYEILVMAHTKFNPRAPLTSRREGVNFMINGIPQFFMISGNFENVLLAACRNYEEYNLFKNSVLKLYKSHEFIRIEPKICLFPVAETMFVKDYDFTSLLLKLWDIDDIE